MPPQTPTPDPNPYRPPMARTEAAKRSRSGIWRLLVWGVAVLLIIPATLIASVFSCAVAYNIPLREPLPLIVSVIVGVSISLLLLLVTYKMARRL